MKLGPIEDLSNWLPPLGKSEASQHKDVHLIVGDNILPVIPAILSYRSDVFGTGFRTNLILFVTSLKVVRRSSISVYRSYMVQRSSLLLPTPTSSINLGIFTKSQRWCLK